MVWMIFWWPSRQVTSFVVIISRKTKATFETKLQGNILVSKINHEISAYVDILFLTTETIHMIEIIWRRNFHSNFYSNYNDCHKKEFKTLK